MTYPNAQMLDLEGEIGARGSVRINSSNRGPVRKWLVAAGVDSPTARTLTNGMLDAVYNDTSNRELRQLAQGYTPEPPAAPEPKPRPVPTAVSGKGTDADALASQIGHLFLQLQQTQQASLDPEQVRALVAEEVAKLAPRRIEFKIAGKVVEVEGAAHKALPSLVGILQAGVYVWLVGPAGSGKTTLASQAAKALGRKFYSTGAVSSDFRLVGYQTATGELVRTPFRDAFEHGGLFLFDEVDSSNPNALVALNQALANGQYAFPDGMVQKHPDFLCIAAANTWGNGATADYVGRIKQDKATLDRFAFLTVEYDEQLERDLVGPQYLAWAKSVQRLRHAAAELGIKAMFTPRASIHGAKMLATGVPKDVVIAATMRKDLDDATWQKLETKARELKAAEAQ